MPLVRLEKVAMGYGDGPDVLSDVSFALEPGTFQFLFGQSGAGKSSLLKLLYLAEFPRRGRVTMFGRDTARMSRREMAETRRRVGVVFQDFRLVAHLSAFENVALPLRLAGVPEKQALADVGELLDWVGLAEHRDALPSTLSGGQQQRCGIARAVICRPAVLLADEPTGNVDEKVGTRILYLLEELHRLGTTVVIATHDEHLLERFGHPILRLAGGRVTPEAVSARVPGSAS